MYVRLYPWHPVTSTMHKILIHAAIVIKNALLHIDQLSEEAPEHVINISAYTDKTLQGCFLEGLATLMCLTGYC